MTSRANPKRHSEPGFADEVQKAFSSPELQRQLAIERSLHRAAKALGVPAALRAIGAALTRDAATPVDADVLLVALAQAIERGEVAKLAAAVRVARAYAVKVGALLPVPPAKDRAKGAYDRAKRAIALNLRASPRAHPDALIGATRASVAIALDTLNPGAVLDLEAWRAKLKRRCVDKRVPVWDAANVLCDALTASGVSPRVLEKFAESGARASRARSKKPKTR